MKAVTKYVLDHLLRQTALWQTMLALNLLCFVGALTLLIDGSLWGLFSIPTAWAVGYLLGQARTHNAWVEYLSVGESA